MKKPDNLWVIILLSVLLGVSTVLHFVKSDRAADALKIVIKKEKEKQAEAEAEIADLLVQLQEFKEIEENLNARLSQIQKENEDNLQNLQKQRAAFKALPVTARDSLIMEYIRANQKFQ